MQEDLAKKGRASIQDDDRLFSSRFQNSVYDLSMSRQVYEEQAKSIAPVVAPKTASRRQTQIRVPVGQMGIDQLLEQYMGRDSDLNIDMAAFQEMSSIFTQQSSLIVESASVTPKQTNPESRGIQMVGKSTPVKSLAANNAVLTKVL